MVYYKFITAKLAKIYPSPSDACSHCKQSPAGHVHVLDMPETDQLLVRHISNSQASPQPFLVSLWLKICPLLHSMSWLLGLCLPNMPLFSNGSNSQQLDTWNFTMSTVREAKVLTEGLCDVYPECCPNDPKRKKILKLRHRPQERSLRSWSGTLLYRP